MIVRILNEGQWELDDGAPSPSSTHLDDAVEQAVDAGDQDQLTAALHGLLDQVRAAGTRVPDDELRGLRPDPAGVDSTLDDVRALLSESDEGLIPN